ncbi:MAG: VWA domain-containing protein [Chlorobium sp.]|nr:MAG: VWA domain-containing protein [Chlorobium sp.]
MCFARPENIVYLLLLIPLVVFLGYGVMREFQVREAVVRPAMADAMMPRLRRRMVLLKKGLLFSGIALLLFAMTGPRYCSGGRPVLRKGADLVFMLDVSRSMLARDVLPDRLGQAKQEIISISHAVNGGRRAILLFAGVPLVQCPLTTDKEGFDALMGMASPDLIDEQGTSFRTAFELAGTLLEPSAENRMPPGIRGEKIVVLLSDGEDHAGDLRQVVQQLKKAGVRLFVIGVGMRQPVAIPLGGGEFKKDKLGQVVMSSFRPEMLQAMAHEAGGYYFRSRAEHTVFMEVSERINRIAAASRWVMDPAGHESLSLYFLVAGFACLLGETMIGRGYARGW